MKLEQAFSAARMIHDGNNTPKGSHTYLEYGWAIRNRYMQHVLSILEESGYEEWNFSDLIEPEDFKTMNTQVMDISKKSMFVDDRGREIESDQRQVMAPTHEVPIYASLRDQVTHTSDLPLKFVHTGRAFRRPKKYPFPFSLGERGSFIEGHGIHETSELAMANIPSLRETITKLISETLLMPHVQSERPLSTNNPVSKKTICHDIILPDFNRTQIAGMIYFHDDIFAEPFDVRYTKPEEDYGIEHTPSGLHFGFSDNLLLGSIVHSYMADKKRFFLPETLLPHQVSVIIEDGSPQENIKQVTSELTQLGYRFKIIRVQGKAEKQKAFNKMKLQGVPLMIGVNHDGRVGCAIPDTGKFHRELDSNDIGDITQEALNERRTIGETRRDEIESTRILDGNGMDMDVINKAIGKGSIVQIPLTQDDNIVIELEKQMKAGEVLGFQESGNIQTCFQTGKNVSTIASLSRRF